MAMFLCTSPRRTLLPCTFKGPHHLPCVLVLLAVCPMHARTCLRACVHGLAERPPTPPQHALLASTVRRLLPTHSRTMLPPHLASAINVPLGPLDLGPPTMSCADSDRNKRSEMVTCVLLVHANRRHNGAKQRGVIGWLM